MPLNTQEQILIEQRISNEAKSVAVAYLLLIFLGGLGAHRFYLGHIGSAVVMLILFLLGWLLLAVVVGIFFLGVVGIWWLVDLFLIPGMVQAHKNGIRDRLTSEMLVRGG